MPGSLSLEELHRRIEESDGEALRALAHQMADLLHTTAAGKPDMDDVARNALQKSIERFDTIANLIPLSVFELDAEFNITYMNPWGIRKLGIAPAELLGKVNILSFFDTETSARIIQDAEAMLGPGESIGYEYTLISRSGEKIDLLIHGAPRLVDGKLVGFQGIAVDITDIKRARYELRSSTRLLEMMVESIPLGLMLVDKTMHIRLWNRAQEELTGQDRSDAFGRSLLDVVPAFDQPELRQAYQSTLTNGEPAFLLYRPITTLRNNGEKFWLNYLIVPLKDDADEIHGFLQVTEDVTRDHLSQETIRRQKELLDTIIDNLPVGIFVKDAGDDYRFTLWNRQMERIIGFRADEVISHNDFELIDPDLARKYRFDDERVIANGAVMDIPEEPASREHENIIVHTIKLPVKDTEGNPRLLLGILEDITDRKKLEEERMKLLKLESLGVLAGGIAHDFNNILMSLLGNLGMLKMNLKPPDENRAFVDEAERAVIRAKSLTMQLLTFAKGGAPIKETASIEEIVRDSATFVLRGSNVQCSFQFSADLWSVEVDKGQISQVVQNIVINADNAMPGGGLITITATNEVLPRGLGELTGKKEDYTGPKRMVRIHFTDSGHGIPEKYLHRIFDPYFSTKQAGHGLGLAVVHSIVSKHGGHISVKSEADKGSTFTIWLPASVKAMKQTNEQESFVRGNGRILVLDDDRNIRVMIEKLLPKLGYETTTASSGEKAVELYRQAMEEGRPYNLALLDLTVPGGMGGVLVLEQIRAFDPNVKAVASSGYANDQVMTDPARFGFVDVLVKPFDLIRLSHIMHKVVEGKK